MNVLTTLSEKREAKEMVYERKLLKELSLKQLKDRVSYFFRPFFNSNLIFQPAIEEGCIDISIEAYLLGAKMSKFGYFGESEEQVRYRCVDEEEYLVNSLFDYLQYRGGSMDFDLLNESLYLASDQLVGYWWIEGFRKGEMRYKLRLH